MPSVESPWQPAVSSPGYQGANLGRLCAPGCPQAPSWRRCRPAGTSCSPSSGPLCSPLQTQPNATVSTSACLSPLCLLPPLAEVELVWKRSIGIHKSLLIRRSLSNSSFEEGLPVLLQLMQIMAAIHDPSRKPLAGLPVKILPQAHTPGKEA